MQSKTFFKANGQNDGEKKLILSGDEIHSLDELREKFNAEEVLKALSDGSLKRFLKSHYYEREFDAVSNLTLEDKYCLKKICTALKVDYLKQDFVMTAEVEARLKVLKEFTSDEKILQNFNQVALDQEELANLINRGEKTIYLCNNKFSIPLSKNNITYIGIDNPTIENAFTSEQYKKAGIIVENINLPSNVSKEMELYASDVAKQNGYDDYAEKNTPLASYFHNKLKSNIKVPYIRLPYDYSAYNQEFRSEYEAKQALKEYLRKPYNKASSIVNTDNSDCIARTISYEYAKIINDCFDPIKDNLKTLFALKNKSSLYDSLMKLISGSNKALRAKYEKEINDNQEYYNMYDFDYFVDRVSIEKHDYCTSEGALKIFESLFYGGIEFTYNDFLGAVFEMEKDINDHMASFYKAAYYEYLSYVDEIERIIEELGHDFPDFKENESISDYLIRITINSL